MLPLATSPQHFLAACSRGFCCGCCSEAERSPATHLLFQLHADGIGLLEEDGVAPEQVTEGGELVPLPLPEGPEGELEFPLCPLHCRDMEGLSPRTRTSTHSFMIPQKASKPL